MFNDLRQRREEGFTLVELMAVIGIIAVITTIAIGATMKQRTAAWQKVVQQDVSNASIYIAQNQLALNGYQSYTGQSDKSLENEGIPGFKSSPGVMMTVYGSNIMGRNTSCVEGYHSNDTSASYADTSWHIIIDEREILRGRC